LNFWNYILLAVSCQVSKNLALTESGEKRLKVGDIKIRGGEYSIREEKKKKKKMHLQEKRITDKEKKLIFKL